MCTEIETSPYYDFDILCPLQEGYRWVYNLWKGGLISFAIQMRRCMRATHNKQGEKLKRQGDKDKWDVYQSILDDYEYMSAIILLAEYHENVISPVHHFA